MNNLWAVREAIQHEPTMPGIEDQYVVFPACTITGAAVILEVMWACLGCTRAHAEWQGSANLCSTFTMVLTWCCNLRSSSSWPEDRGECM